MSYSSAGDIRPLPWKGMDVHHRNVQQRTICGPDIYETGLFFLNVVSLFATMTHIRRHEITQQLAHRL